MKEGNFENDIKKEEFKPSIVPYASLPLELPADKIQLYLESLATKMEQNRTVEKVKEISNIDDFIENDTKKDELRRSIMPFDSLSLELRLELQEEIEFQKRFEKQQRAIEEVKKIAQARYEYNKNWFDAAYQGDLDLEDYISVIDSSDEFLAKSKRERENNLDSMRSIYCQSGIDWKDGIESDKDFFGVLLEAIEGNSPYILDVLYLKITVFNNYEGRKQSSENNEYIHCCKMLAILEPFLTEEFKSFFKQIKKHPAFCKGDGLILCSFDFFDNESARKEAIAFYRKVVEKVESNPLLVKSLLGNAVFLKWKSSVSDSIKQLRVQEELTRLSVKKKIEKEKAISLIHSDLLEQWRTSFSVIYNLNKEVKEIDTFINTFLESSTVIKEKEIFSSSIKATKKCVEIVEPELVKSEIVEMVPVLDKTFLEDIKGNESVEQLYQVKKQQLFLWQERVKQRKAQKEEQVRMRRACIEDEHAKETGEIMERQHAEQLITLYSNLDKDSQEFFNYFFNSSCQPQNIRFKDIVKLVESFGGTLDIGKGSSHFPIHLPNTKRIWEHKKQTLVIENYIDVPKVTRKSHKSHNISYGWSCTAHILLKQAFEKAGITPDRLARAQQMMKVTESLAVRI